MEKTKGEQLQEELMMKMVNGTTRLSDEEIDKAYDYAEGYKKYMDAAKIEMEAVREAIRRCRPPRRPALSPSTRPRSTRPAIRSTTTTAANL